MSSEQSKDVPDERKPRQLFVNEPFEITRCDTGETIHVGPPYKNRPPLPPEE